MNNDIKQLATASLIAENTTEKDLEYLDKTNRKLAYFLRKLIELQGEEQQGRGE